MKSEKLKRYVLIDFDQWDDFNGLCDFDTIDECRIHDPKIGKIGISTTIIDMEKREYANLENS